MFSQTAEYALRATVMLAQNPLKPLTTQQIALQTKVPAGYLSKVLQMLTRSEIIKATRGLHGGYLLRRPAQELTILDVINAVDPLKHICRCPLDLPEHEGVLCPLHRRMNDAIEQVEQALGSATLEELLAESPDRRPLGK